MVWADEFDVDGAPDSTNWGFEQGFVRNEELQWYPEDNAYDPSITNWRENRGMVYYTSASLNTKDSHTWKYGRFETRRTRNSLSGI